MITAKEALENFDSIKKDANLFIKEIIEPQIKDTMRDATFIEVSFASIFCYGSVYGKPYGIEIKNVVHREYLTVELTKAINKILEENGYVVHEVIEKCASEYSDGYGKFIISWGD